MTATVEHVVTTYTLMGTRVDQEDRQNLRQAIEFHIRNEVEHGQHDLDTLAAVALKHLVSLEHREPRWRGRL